MLHTGIARFALENCPRVDDSLAAVFPSAVLRQMEALSLAGCCNLTDEGTAAIVDQLQNVRELSLRQCYIITDESLQRLGRWGSSRGHALPTRRSHRAHVGSPLLSSHAHPKAASAPLLRVLDLGMCANITDKGAAARRCCVPLLRPAAASWRRCCVLAPPTATHCGLLALLFPCTGVLAVATACQRLEQVHLRECPLLTQAGITTLQEAGIRISRA